MWPRDYVKATMMRFKRHSHLIALTVFCGLSFQTFAQDEEGQDVEALLQTSDAIFLTQVASVSTFEYVVTFEIFFRGDKLDANVRIGNDEAGLPEFESRRVARILALNEMKSSEIEILGCVENVCRPLGITNRRELKASPDGDFVLFEVGPSSLDGRQGHDISRTDEGFEVQRRQRSLQEGEDLRLFVPAGWATLDKSDGVETLSPEMSVVLPKLGKQEKGILGSNPLFKFSLSPLTESQKSETTGASLFFSGAYKRFSRSHVIGATYSGSIGTDDDISFQKLQADFEYIRNLLSKRGDYLPLTLSGGLESDQSFDLVNVLAGAQLQYLLPFNVNRSPADDYIPNVGPLFTIKAELGKNVRETTDAQMMQTNPDEFQRAGYELSWTIPIARATELRLHHAGIWVFSDVAADEYHRLWDVAIETKIGNITYFIGYQEGEAAPLFQPIQTTQIGIVVRFGDKYKCAQNTTSGSAWSCGSP